MARLHDPVLLHVGYIKTATTFLQKQVFDDPRAGLALAAGRQTRTALVKEILLADDYTFDAQATRSRLEMLCADVRDRGDLPVWSEEMLLGNPPSRRYDGWSNAHKLNAVYPRAKVLITIRRQDALVRSIWGEYVRGGGRLPLQSVIGTAEEPEGHTPVLKSDFLHFDAAIKHYHDLFGAKRVLVLPQEMLDQNPTRFYAALADFTDRQIDPDRPRKHAHVGEGAFVLRLRRTSNHLIRIDPIRARRQGVPAMIDKVLRRLDHFVPPQFDVAPRGKLQAWITARYQGEFTQSNRRTAALTGLDLGQYGYDV